MTESKKTVLECYDNIAYWFDEQRSRDLFEKAWLNKALQQIKPGSTILDLGCGMGEPIAKYCLGLGYSVLGVDGCQTLLSLAKDRLPQGEFIIADMRQLALNKQFDAIIAWDSFFHLTQDEQRLMFPIFANHLNQNGMLLFTGGPDAGEVWSDNGGEDLYHASLSPDEYQTRLNRHGFEMVDFKLKDEDCRGHSVWLAKLVKRTELK